MTARNPRWANTDHSAILLEIQNQGEWVDYVAQGDDPFADPTIYQDATEEAYGPIAEYVAPTPVPLRYVSKQAMTERLTEDESDQLQAALDQAPGKLQLLYASVSRIDTQSPHFQTLHDTIAATLGSNERADVILTPTD